MLADALKENKALYSVVLDDNPVGQRGCRAVLRSLRKLVQYGWPRSVSLARCNFHVRSSETLFDPADAGGQWDCDLSEPYGNAPPAATVLKHYIALPALAYPRAAARAV